jgi:hypothetical protein
MPLTNYPHGVTSFGIPLIGSGTQIPVTTGSYFFVDSNTGAAGNDGKSPLFPFATIAQAVSACTEDKGDVIILMPGHAEALTTTSFALSKAGIQVVGLGTGLKRPTFTAAVTGGTATISANNCSVKNCRFVANVDNAVTAFTTTTAKYFTAEDIDFVDNSNALHWLSACTVGTTDNAADGLSVINCTWNGLALAPAAFISITGDLDYPTILGNKVTMAATDDEGHFITLSSDTIRYANIGYNMLDVTGSTGAAVGIFLTGSATDCSGFVHNNYVASLDTTAELIATAGTGLKFINNYYTGTADASGKLWPVVDGA